MRVRFSLRNAGDNDVASEPPRRLLLPPATTTLRAEGCDSRQVILSQQQRSPSVFRLIPLSSTDTPETGPNGEQHPGRNGEPSYVGVQNSSGALLGWLPAPFTAPYQRLLAKATRRGRDVWVHGQVIRDGLDLQLELRAPSGRDLPRSVAK